MLRHELPGERRTWMTHSAQLEMYSAWLRFTSSSSSCTVSHSTQFSICHRFCCNSFRGGPRACTAVFAPAVGAFTMPAHQPPLVQMRGVASTSDGADIAALRTSVTAIFIGSCDRVHGDNACTAQHTPFNQSHRRRSQRPYKHGNGMHTEWQNAQERKLKGAAAGRPRIVGSHQLGSTGHVHMWSKTSKSCHHSYGGALQVLQAPMLENVTGVPGRCVWFFVFMSSVTLRRPLVTSAPRLRALMRDPRLSSASAPTAEAFNFSSSIPGGGGGGGGGGGAGPLPCSG